MTDETENNLKPDKQPDGSTSKTPGNDKEQLDGSTSETPGNDKEQLDGSTSKIPGNDKEQPDGSTSKTPGDDKEQRSKTDNKDFAQGRYSSKGQQYWNPFGSQEKRQQENKSQYSSQYITKEDSKYSSWTIEELENLKKRYEQNTEILRVEDQDLSDKIKAKMAGRRYEKDGEREYKYKRELEELKVESKKVQEELDGKEQELREIKRELKRKKENSKRERDGRTKDGINKSDLSKEVKNITAQSLFADDDPIKNTILYVATFFPGLNPQDFKRIVSLLLADRTKTINVKESITTEEGKTQVKETQQEKLLTEIWQESFEKSDEYLKNCYLKVSRQNGVQGIYFAIPSLRNDFLTYFEEQKPLYLEEQLQKTQRLNLLLNTSDDVARKAIDLAVKASIDYPSSYEEGWLIGLLLEIAKIAKEDERRSNTLLVRLSNLIYRLQIEQDYSRAKDIAQRFLESLMLLESLMSPENRGLAFVIVEDLMDKHLRSGSLGIQPAKQLLTWLKKLLDQENWEQKNTDLQADVYNLLNRLLWQSGFYYYIYDFLGILKEWLPEKDIPSKNYSPSNISALLLLFVYCKETILIWNSHLDWYGEWPSIYPLFAPLKNQDGSYTSNRFDRELNILFSWLFYSTSSKELALINVFNSLQLDDIERNNINPLEEIGGFIAEWLVILRGFDDVESEKEVENLIEDMTRSIISNTSRSLKSELNNFWTSLTEKYLDQGAKSNQSGDRKSQKQFTARRKILRDFKKKFRALQKEMKAEK